MKPVLVTPGGALYNTDCLDLFRNIRSESIDTVFADPPFNIGKDYRNGRPDDLESRHYLNWCRQWIKESVRVVKSGGAVLRRGCPKNRATGSGFFDERNQAHRN
ncbi:MAG: DNA methyltransferase [Acidobacteriota bacterium]